MTTHKDGDRINLPLGWYMLLDASTREEPDLQGFVFTPDGKQSCSLNAARDYGNTTGPGDEVPLPEKVHAAVSLPLYNDFE